MRILVPRLGGPNSNITEPDQSENQSGVSFPQRIINSTFNLSNNKDPGTVVSGVKPAVTDLRCGREIAIGIACRLLWQRELQLWPHMDETS